MSPPQQLHPVAWLLWFLAVGAVPLTSRQPLYLLLTLLVVIVVHLALPAGEERGNPWRLFAYVGSTVAVLSIGFNVLTVHTGDRAFAELPDSWPIIGGPLTYNALVYGVASALAISSLLFAAATFNAAVRHMELIRRLPSSFQQFGVAGAIALSYVPHTMQAGRDIYDAQRARGHQMRSVGAARAFLVPLLGNGLERAITTSEALETRGYGSTDLGSRQKGLGRWRFALALLLLVTALPLLATGRIAAALFVALVAVAALTVGRRQSKQRVQLTGWDRPSLAIATAAIAALGVILAAIVAGQSLSYSPFPRLVWPGFNPIIGAAILLQLAPAFVAHRVDR